MEPEALEPDPPPRPAGPAGAETIHARPALSRTRLWLSGVLTGLASAVLISLVSPGGPDLVSIVSPQAGQVVGLEGVQVMVRFPDDGRIAPETLRILLNGADVTRSLTTGQNGAVGRLHGLLDGENVLRIEVEASSWWSDDRRFESGREVRFKRRPPPHLDRGARPAPWPARLATPQKTLRKSLPLV